MLVFKQFLLIFKTVHCAVFCDAKAGNLQPHFSFARQFQGISCQPLPIRCAQGKLEEGEKAGSFHVLVFMSALPQNSPSWQQQLIPICGFPNTPRSLLINTDFPPWRFSFQLQRTLTELVSHQNSNLFPLFPSQGMTDVSCRYFFLTLFNLSFFQYLVWNY